MSGRKAVSLRIPGLGRLILTGDPGEGRILGRDQFHTRLTVVHRDVDGRVLAKDDCGSGIWQQNFSIALAADSQSADNAAPLLGGPKYMITGTGATATVYDYQLGAAVSPASGLLSAPTIGWSNNNPTLTYSATIQYAASLAIAEWGLFNSATAGAYATMAASSGQTYSSSGMSGGTWSTSLGGTANLLAGYIVVSGTSAGFISANGTGTGGSVTIIGGWYNLTSSGGNSGATPAAGAAAAIYPLMLDHRVLPAVYNVTNGQQLTFAQTMTFTSGG